MPVSELPPVYDANSRILILGSYPSVRSRAAGFYYANPHNRFWRVMSTLFDVDMTDVTAERKTEILLSLRIAISDVVYSCNIDASADSTIRDVTASDIPSIIACGKISRIFLNGKTAYNLFCRYFPAFSDMAVCLPSTSPANAAKSFDDLLSEWRVVYDTLNSL